MLGFRLAMDGALRCGCAKAVGVLMLWAAPALAEPPPVISRELLFGNPVRDDPTLSRSAAHGATKAWPRTLSGVVPVIRRNIAMKAEALL
ncbi:hypothetical protein D7X55_04955 [Corallococcus sp. AB049A]|uniref:Uncharacterized protein n=1 Tax=Corallococcus interemptor TaxID=2316720 RepID=A0A3A8Q5R6_9BACT|nr:hypothetical protein D7Y23_01545 [Corallococcus sp. AB050B]RKH64023.1 hypothetical protein D7X96_26575 [Corallococcus interemptor]RKI73626.1 hypothetical protein D7X55_04955 [Corallococcus sp. AB049A]